MDAPPFNPSQLLGKTVAAVQLECSNLARLVFADGTSVEFMACWCNDGTADLDISFKRPEGDQ